MKHAQVINSSPQNINIKDAMKYSEDEMNRLTDMWPCATSKELREEFPNRKPLNLCQKALSMGLVNEVHRSRRGNLTPLLQDTPEAWYWLGFFLADGHMTKTGQLVFVTSFKDEDHLEKLACFLKTSVKKPYNKEGVIYRHLRYLPELESDRLARSIRRIAIMDKKVCHSINIKFGLNGPKTKNPPSIEKLSALTSDQIIFLFIGIFDGDGSVRRSGSKRFLWGSGEIECHANWLPILEFFENKNLVSNCRITSSGYAKCTVPLSTMLKLKDVNVPKMERKWSKFNERN